MKKLLKPAKRKGLKPSRQNKEIIDLDDKVVNKLDGPDKNDDEILDLTDEIASKKQESLETGVIELTDQVLSSSPPSKKAKDKIGKVSNNVIHLSDMTVSDQIDESEKIEAITQEDILDLESDENFQGNDDENLAQLTKRLESAISTSYGDEDDEPIESLPEANLIELEDDDNAKDGMDGFGLLPEAEPGMADNIDSLGIEELDDDTTFADIGDHIADQMPDFSLGTEDFGDSEDHLDDNFRDEDISEAALELNRAMRADRDGAYPVDADDDLSDEIQNIRNKLDNVFPEEDSEDSLSIFNTFSQKEPNDADEDEFDTDELILPPFDENEAGAMAAVFGAKPFKAQEQPIDLTPDAKIAPQDAFAASPQDSFDNSINFYNTGSAPPQNKVDPFEAEVTVSNDELESAVLRIIETKFGNKIERMIVQAIEKAVSREIVKIKRAILDESDSID